MTCTRPSAVPVPSRNSHSVLSFAGRASRTSAFSPSVKARAAFRITGVSLLRAAGTGQISFRVAVSETLYSPSGSRASASAGRLSARAVFSAAVCAVSAERKREICWSISTKSSTPPPRGTCMTQFPSAFFARAVCPSRTVRIR